MRYLIAIFAQLLFSATLQGGSYQNWDSKYLLVNRWAYPESKLTGYVFDAFLDPKNNTLIMMLFRDGIKLISKDGISDLTKIGQGPGEIARWSALSLEGDYVIVFEATGKIIYYRRNMSSYIYEKTKWLRWGTEFPVIRGAVTLNNKYYLTGFSLKSEPSTTNSEAFFLTIFNDSGLLIKQLIWKDFKGFWRGPPLLTSHIRQHGSEVWVILESEPTLYIIDTKEDKVRREVHLETPVGFKPIRDYIPVNKYTISTLQKKYEEWVLSYSRIESLIITDNYLILQARTCINSGPKYFVMLYDVETFALKETYLTDHLLLAENDGHYYFLANGDPGLDENAYSVDIRIYKAKGK